MIRVAVFVDGFNLYHAIDEYAERNDPAWNRLKWLDLTALAEQFTDPKDEIVEVEYFTALTPNKAASRAKHSAYIDALSINNVTVTMGRFKKKPVTCRGCVHWPAGKIQWMAPVEKETDINIAVSMMRKAFEDKFDKAILITGDGDLIPCVRTIKAMFPQKRVELVIPIKRFAKDLSRHCQKVSYMKRKHLINARFTNSLNHPELGVIECPDDWR